MIVLVGSVVVKISAEIIKFFLRLGVAEGGDLYGTNVILSQISCCYRRRARGKKGQKNPVCKGKLGDIRKASNGNAISLHVPGNRLSGQICILTKQLQGQNVTAEGGDLFVTEINFHTYTP